MPGSRTQRRTMLQRPPMEIFDHHRTRLADRARGVRLARLEPDGGFAHEVAWQATAGRATLTTGAFLREAAWVVLSSGMRESVVRVLFRRFARVLHDFNPTALSADPSAARDAALAVFGHKGKVNAILDIAATVDHLGEDGLRGAIRDDPQSFLCSLPYVGPVTWRHPAKTSVCGSRSPIGT